MKPEYEHAIRSLIASRRRGGDQDLVVLSPGIEDTVVDGVPVYGSFVEGVEGPDGEIRRGGVFFIMTRVQWEALRPRIGSGLGDIVLSDIEEFKR